MWGAPKPPASSAWLIARGSSSNLNGFPAVSVHDPLANPLVEVTRHGGCNQRPRVFLGEPLERQARQGGKQLLLAGLPDRKQQQDRLSEEAPAYESKDLA